MHDALALAATAIQMCIGFIFAAAGIGKVFRWHEFKGMLDAYRLLPSALVPVAACLIVPAELAVAGALIAGWCVFETSVLAAAMLIAFAGAMAINLARGRRSIDCGCFQSMRQQLEWRLVVRNIACAAAVLAASNFSMPFLDSERWLHGLPAGATLFAIYSALNAVWALDASRELAFRRS